MKPNETKLRLRIGRNTDPAIEHLQNLRGVVDPANAEAVDWFYVETRLELLIQQMAILRDLVSNFHAELVEKGGTS